MAKILLIGNGAREHIIAEKLVYSKAKPTLFAYMKANNPGIAKLAEQSVVGPYSDLDEIERFATSLGVDFVFIGPEEPLGYGVVDVLERAGIACVGPTKELARLETSKSFTRMLTEKYDIEGSPKFKVFSSDDGILEYLKELGSVVIKADGLAGGKGVKVQGDHFETLEEGYTYCKQVLSEHPCVVVEEKLIGEEFSLQSFTDGKSLFHCPVVQDHKRAYVGDKGPNTGGMGSYSCGGLLPFMTEEDLEAAKEITDQMRDALFKETGTLYKGVMYGGFIITKTGVKLIEFNARMGDPEALNVLSIMETDFVELCLGVISGNIHKVESVFASKATVCKYAVPEGYPEAPVADEKIFLGEVPKEVKYYYASVDKKEDGVYMTGSRAVAFVGVANALEEAQVLAEDGVCSAQGKIFHREDIGTAQLVQKRVDHMKSLRSE
jgi:phosphoribosylamine--glycine ligase